MATSGAATLDAVAGALGSCIAFGVTYPLTTVSTWQALQHQAQAPHDALEAAPGKESAGRHKNGAAVHVQDAGWGPLFAGIRPFLVATAISQGLYFGLYSRLRTMVVNQRAAGGTGGAPNLSVAGSLAVASLAGSINAAATHPMWLIAMRQQAQAQRKGRGTPEVQQSVAAMVREVYDKDGVLGYWRGLAPALIMVVNPTLQYALYEWLAARLLRLKQRRTTTKAAAKAHARLTASDAFLLSALAKLGATLATYPMLVVKNRMQAAGPRAAPDERYPSVAAAIATIVRHEGWQGLFKGMKAKMLQTVLGAALLMAIKEQLNASLRALLQPRHALATAR